MSLPSRKAIADAASTVVVKVGTRVLTDSQGLLDSRRVAHLAQQLAAGVAAGRRMVLVSSGAVGAGIGRLALDRRPVDLAELQAVASVGQSCLIEAYNRALEPHGYHAAQVLLTVDDFNDRTRYLNVRNTLFALFQLQAIPIVNENDVVRVDELQRNFGDNDRLAAMVAHLLRAPLLVLLSDVEGVYDLSQPAVEGRHSVFPHLDLATSKSGELVGELPTGSQLQLSRGGMQSKLESARLVTSSGDRVIIASGRRDGVLTSILAGEEIGTLISSPSQGLNSRKRWIGSAARCAGQVAIDSGAVDALVARGRSLLAVGVTTVVGNFQKGDVISLRDPEGREIARGLTNYSAADLRQIAGQPTTRIAEILGYRPYEEVVHRDNLAVAK